MGTDNQFNILLISSLASLPGAEGVFWVEEPVGEINVFTIKFFPVEVSDIEVCQNLIGAGCKNFSISPGSSSESKLN